VQDLDREGRLELRLVEAWERAPRIGCLELRRGVSLLTAHGAVQAAERIPDAAGPLDLERVLACGDVLRELQDDDLRLVLSALAREEVRAVDRCLGDLELDRVQDDLARRLRGAEGDALPALGGPGVEIEVELASS